MIQNLDDYIGNLLIIIFIHVQGTAQQAFGVVFRHGFPWVLSMNDPRLKWSTADGNVVQIMAIQ